jgi:ABC-2 type transport system permease protein
VELLKTKRTLALAVALIVPLAVLIVIGANVLSRDPGAPLPGDAPWNAFVVNFASFFWCVLAFPLLIALEAALLAQLEHGQHHWKDLYALPIPRWTLYAAKLLVTMSLIALSLVVLGVGLGLEGAMLQALRPGLGLIMPIPWLDIVRVLGTMFSAALLLIALLTWIAVRWPSFAVPSVIGVTGAVVGLMLDISARADAWARIFPWSMPLTAISPIDERRPIESHVIALGLGIAGGLVVAILGGWDATRRDVV